MAALHEDGRAQFSAVRTVNEWGPRSVNIKNTNLPHLVLQVDIKKGEEEREEEEWRKNESGRKEHV